MTVALRAGFRDGRAPDADLGALVTTATAAVVAGAAALIDREDALVTVRDAAFFALAGLIAPGASQLLFTRAVRDARSLPFSALEADDGSAFEPGAFGADGRWASAPPRLDADPETGLLGAELRAHLLEAGSERGATVVAHDRIRTRPPSRPDRWPCRR